MPLSVLIVEDDRGLRLSLEKSFRRQGYEVLSLSRVSEAQRLLGERAIDLMLLDVRLADGSGFDVLATARNIDEEIVVIIMTAYPDLKTAVRAMKEGARDFIVKPFELEELHLTVKHAVEARALRRDVQRLEHERSRRNDVTELLGESAAIEKVRREIRKVAPTTLPVLTTGETGTGKELVVDCIHRLSERARGPLVKVNCSAFSEQILESELFGHERGAFTDAKEARAGLFEMSDGGTVFLDEIAEMHPGLQAKLLRVVEGQPFRRVGGQREIRADVRIVAATNRDLEALIQSGAVRQDLYFRLNTFQISMPPLRTRGNDVALLARFFLQRSSMTLRKPPLRLSPEAEALLADYPWPGNVRELRNVMERAAILCEGDEVGAVHLSGQLQAAVFVHRHVKERSDAFPLLAEIEHQYMEHVLEHVGGNLSEAARILGIARNTLKARLLLPADTSRRA